MGEQVKKLSFLLCLILTQFEFALAGGEGWNLVRDKNGIQVFRRPVEDSQIDAVRGVTTVESSLGRLLSIILDPARRMEWDKFCGESYLYETVNENEELVYVHSDMPWPVSDRDMLMRVSWEQDPETLVVNVNGEGTKGVLPVQKDRIRVTQASHSWVLTPLENGLIEVETVAHLDPAGPLPAWLINMLSVESPYDALLRISNMAKNSNVHVENNSFVREP
ncbi:START domain-containing protein [Spongiibacter marinus]|uniref:START domain-containing protein n=1 Tax=Spongiibacter marinus TaxID=354246 RepID=UPI0035BE33E8